MSIQAVLFGISEWCTNDARKWLKKHNITPIKIYIKQQIYYDIE